MHSSSSLGRYATMASFAGGLWATILFVQASPNLVLDQSGNAFLEENNSGKIVKIAANGARSTFASGDEANPINGDLAIDAAGNLYACMGRTTIVKFSPDGKPSTFATGVGINWPNALAM